MSIVLGQDVALQDNVDGEYITVGCAVSCSFEFVNEIIGKTDANAGLFRKKRVRVSDCRGSVQGLLISESTPTRLSAWHFLQEGVRRSERDIRIVFTDQSGNIKTITGTFIVSALSLVADVSAFTDFDIQLEGTGQIALSEIAPPGEVVCEGLFSDYWLFPAAATSISGLSVNGESYASKDIIAVYREGTEQEPTSGTPGNREYAYDGTSISFDPLNPSLGERVFVIWLDDES